VQLDQLYGADAIAFKIEFLGLDMATRNLIDYPLPDKYMKTGKTLQIFGLWMYCTVYDVFNVFFLVIQGTNGPGIIGFTPTFIFPGRVRL
jgi:hypothetical protein